MSGSKGRKRGPQGRVGVVAADDGWPSDLVEAKTDIAKPSVATCQTGTRGVSFGFDAPISVG